MNRPMIVGAWGTFKGDTAITYTPCQEGSIELMIGGAKGFDLLVTDSGLAKLADVIDAARKDERRLELLDEGAQ